MSFKTFSTSHSASAKDKAGNKPKDAPAVERPTVQSEKTPAKATPSGKP